MPAIPFAEQRDITDVAINGDTAFIDIWYPGSEGRPAFLVVGLEHVRAADNIRISYDFVRDGWKIEQASTFSWEAGDSVCDPGWAEVAFIHAWAREKKES